MLERVLSIHSAMLRPWKVEGKVSHSDPSPIDVSRRERVRSCLALTPRDPAKCRGFGNCAR